VKDELLLATYNRLILWDGKPRTIWDKRGHPDLINFYGITWDENVIYVTEGGHPKPSKASLIHKFDGGLNHVGQCYTGPAILDPHQIYWRDGKLYVANTGKDNIVVIRNLEKSQEQETIQWVVLEIGDTIHVNSIFSQKRRLFFAEHRKKRMPKRIRVFSLGHELVETIELDAGFVKTKPHGIHNVYVEGGYLYTCSPNALMQHNLATREMRAIVPSPLMREAHYVRGLARSSSRWFIGLSEVKVRSERGKGDSAVLVLNNDFETVDLLPLRDTGGLNEIRLVSALDLAHNGVRCPYG